VYSNVTFDRFKFNALPWIAMPYHTLREVMNEGGPTREAVRTRDDELRLSQYGRRGAETFAREGRDHLCPSSRTGEVPRPREERILAGAVRLYERLGALAVMLHVGVRGERQDILGIGIHAILLS